MKTYIIIIMAIALTSCGSNKDHEAAENTVPVSVSHPITGNLTESVLASGTISSEDQLTLSFKVSGVIEKTLMPEGREVKKGQLLARLNSQELSEQLRQSNLNISKLMRDEKRLAALVKDTVATLESLQNAQTALQTAISQKESILYNLSQTDLYAPLTGIVTEKSANRGEFKSAGSPIYMLATNAGTKKWVFKTALSDKERLKLKTGQEATVELDGLPGKTYQGKVTRLDNIPDATTGTYACYVALNNNDPTLVYGLSGHMNIGRQENNRSSETLIPLSSLSGLKYSTAYIYILNADSTAKKEIVHILQINGDQVSISESLPKDASVITYGKSNIREGLKLKVIPQ